MADFDSCINDAVSGAGVRPEIAEGLRDTYREVRAGLDDALSPGEADRQAAEAATRALQGAALEEKRHRVLMIRTRTRILEGLAEWKAKRGYTDVRALGNGSRGPDGGWIQGGKPPAEGPYVKGKAAADLLIELIDGQGGEAGSSIPSVRGRYQAVRGRFDAMMADLFEKFESRTGFDRPGRALLENVVHEAFGRETGDQAAKGFAQAWKETAEYARQLFNEAGGNIGKLDDWGMPQSHNYFEVMNAGKQPWVDFIEPLIDRTKMVDELTGAAFSPARLRYALGTVYDNIATKGAISREPGESLGIGMLAKRRQDERFLAFKDPESWLTYQARFGREDPYAAMQAHLDSMARDIGQMQVLGPNPRHQLDWLAKFAEREAMLEEASGIRDALGAGQHAIGTAKTMFGLFSGEIATPYGVRNVVATVGSSVRSALSGIQLGSAVINDLVSNPVFAAYTRVFTGMSKTGDFAAWASWMARPEARQLARRQGFILEGSRARLANAVQDMLRSQTVGGKIYNGANVLARRLPIAVYKASGLSPNIAASRWAFQHEFMGLMHDLRDVPLPELLNAADADKRQFGRTLRARGFTPEDWDQIRATPPEEPAPGATFISPKGISQAHGDELSFRVAEMIERQTRLAVPEPSLWAHAKILGESRPGTFEGELRRSVGSYRSFTVTQSYLWSRELMSRSASSQHWMAVMGAQAAGLLTTLTVAGAIGVQLREILKGNDPRPMGDSRFWGAAVLYGGGLGIVGDFLYSATARTGKGSALTGMGAPAAALADAYSLTAGMAIDPVTRHAAHPDESLGESFSAIHPGRRVVRAIGNYSPLSSIWWGRAAWNRLVVDQLQKGLDPEAEDAFDRALTQNRTTYGQGAWWAPGEAIPTRAPNLANARERQEQ